MVVAHIINKAKGVFTTAIKKNSKKMGGAVRVATANLKNVNIRNVDGEEKVEKTRSSVVNVPGTKSEETTAVLMGATG